MEQQTLQYLPSHSSQDHDMPASLPGQAPTPGPITSERTRLQQELLEKALEKELAELEKEEQLVELEVLLPRLVAGVEGDEETLLAISKKSDANYFKKKLKSNSNTSPAPLTAS